MKNAPINKEWERSEIIKHEFKIINVLDQYEKQLIVRTGKQIIYKSKYDFFGLFAKRLPIKWVDWKIAKLD